MDQQPLIQLTDDELRLRGQILARMTLELADLKAQNAELKKDMAIEERTLSRQIAKVAASIREGRHEAS